MSRPVLLIAGGSRGIGAATARLAGARGYDVAVNYKTNSNAATSVVKAVEKAGGKAIAIQGDMALENDIERVFNATSDKLGSPTHFVHSSGIIGDNSRLDDVSPQTIRDVLDVDTFRGAALSASMYASHVYQARRQRWFGGHVVVDGRTARRRQ